MQHEMHLEPPYFQAIKKGMKKIEIRLADEKRRKIKVGDHIQFNPLRGNETPLTVEVTSLRRFHSFKEMYHTMDRKDFGFSQVSIEEMLKETYAIYSSAAEEKWGVLAIGIK